MKLFLLLAVLAFASARKNVGFDATWTYDARTCNAPGGSTHRFTVVYAIDSTTPNPGKGSIKDVTVTSSVTADPVANAVITTVGTCPTTTIVPGQTFTCDFDVTATEEVNVTYLTEGARNHNDNGNGMSQDEKVYYTVKEIIIYYKAASAVITNKINPICFEATTGEATIEIVANALTGPYKLYRGTAAIPANLIKSDLAANTPWTITGLSAGTTKFFAQSLIGCSASAEVELTGPLDAVTFTTTVTDPVCTGGQGSVLVTGNGGTSPYNFSLNGGAWTTPAGASWTFEGPNGSHTVQAQDSKGCLSGVETIIITDPLDFGVTANSTSADCYVAGNGKITAWITGARTGSFDIVLTKPSNATFSASQTIAKGAYADFLDLTVGTYVVSATNAGCTRTFTITVATPLCYCALSQGYYKNHQETWAVPPTNCSTVAPGPCSNWCGKSFTWYLAAVPKGGNAVIIAGKQFAAFVLNFWYYNTYTNIRVAGLPANFDAAITAAFTALNTITTAQCTTPTAAYSASIITNAGLLEGFNSHNSTLYPWNSQCTPSAARTLISTIRK